MNIRYKDLSADVAGDEDQFFHTLFQSIEGCKSKNQDKHYQSSMDCWEKYRLRESDSILNTFYYMFYKIKKGIFVRVRDGELKLFLPFVNKHFQNEWADQIKAPPGSSIEEIIKTCTIEQGRKWNRKRLNTDIQGWWANNCLVRYEYPPMETNRNLHTIENYIIKLCREEKINDIDFFINKRDFPIMKTDGTEPYNNIWGTTKKKLISHNYKTYAPIFSMVSSPCYADIPFTTWDDMEMIERGPPPPSQIEWKNKLSVAIWRGTSTGAGISSKDNMRLKLAKLSMELSRDDLDAGITKWNCRPRKLENSPYLQVLEPSKLGIRLKEWMSYEEQQKYKYIICIDGHVSAFRLSSNLNSGSVVLLVESDWDMWYMKYFTKWEHYVPVKKDLSDLVEKIKWCKNNDDEVFSMTQKAHERCNEIFFTNHYSIIADIINKHSNPYKDQINHLTTQRNAIIKDPETKPIKFPTKYILGEKIFIGKLSCVQRYKSFVIKSSSNGKKIKEHKNELFIGLNCLNLINSPNFSKTIGWFQNGNTFNIVSKFIEGETLQKWIYSDTFNYKDLKNILSQITLAILQAQEQNGFIHWDLTPWNIIITPNKNGRDLEYNLYNGTGWVRLKNPKYIAVIIDYGKSRVIKNNKFYGYVNIFSSNIEQDMYTLLVSVLREIIFKRNITHGEWEEYNNLLYLVIKEKLSCRDLKNKLMKMCKYQNLSTRIDHKQKLQPIHFFHYLNTEHEIICNQTTVNIEKFKFIETQDPLMNMYQLQLYENSGGKDKTILQKTVDLKNLETNNDITTTPININMERFLLNPIIKIPVIKEKENMFWKKHILNSILTYPNNKIFSIPLHYKKDIIKRGQKLLNIPGIILHHNFTLTFYK